MTLGKLDDLRDLLKSKDENVKSEVSKVTEISADLDSYLSSTNNFGGSNHIWIRFEMVGSILGQLPAVPKA